MRPQLLLVAIAATVVTTPHAVTSQTAMTRDRFLATAWRVTGGGFSIVPPDGFPIAFRPDGTVVTKNLASITKWSLRDDELSLSGEETSRVIRFTWLPVRGVFRHCPVPSRIPLYVFPERSADPLSVGCDDVAAALLNLRIELDKATYYPGERIVAIATLTNVGNAPIVVRRSDDETGRSDGFLVEVTQNSVNALPSAPPAPRGDSGVAEPLPPGGMKTRQLVLNRLLGSPKPGKYRLTIGYTARYPDRDTGIWSDPVTLEIVPPK